MIKIWFLKIISGKKKKKTYSETHKVHIKGKSCVAISLRWIRKQNLFFFFFFCISFCFLGFLVSLRDAKNVMKMSVASWSKNLEANDLTLYGGVMVMKYRSWVETHLIPNFAAYTQIKVSLSQCRTQSLLLLIDKNCLKRMLACGRYRVLVFVNRWRENTCLQEIQSLGKEKISSLMDHWAMLGTL